MTSMPTFSDRTVSTLAQVLENRYTRQPMCAKLMEFGVPHRLISQLDKQQANKLKVAMEGLEYLRQHATASDIAGLVQEVLASHNIEPEDTARIERALMADGFVVADGRVVPGQPDEEEVADAVRELVGSHEEFDRETILHHLAECEDLYVQEKWDSSIGQARNAVEQLLNDIASALAQERGDSPSLSQPRNVRGYLESIDFLDDTERKRLIDGVYGYLSDEGSHPGISDQSSARVSRLLIKGIVFYLIEKYDGWDA